VTLLPVITEEPKPVADLAAEARERREREAAERRPIQVGIGATILVHLLLLLLLPQISRVAERANAGGPTRQYDERELNLLLAPEEPAPPPGRFVETNPDAPENIPDKTSNYGARNQQAAQPVPGKDNSELPKTTGEVDQSTAIVTGSKAPPIESAPSGGGTPGEQQLVATANGAPLLPKASTPLPGFEKITGDNPEGIGTNIGENPKNTQDVDKKVEGQAEGPEQGQNLAVNGGGTGQPGRPGPRPRPKLQSVRPAVLANQPFSASNAGVTAANSRLSAFGVWWQEFIDTVDAEWQKTVENLSTYPPPHSRVTIRFMVNSKGEIAKIIEIEGAEATGKMGTYACLDAINARAPYKPWTPDMIAFFGKEEEEVIFQFFYY
jgi:hypothetical protein